MLQSNDFFSYTVISAGHQLAEEHGKTWSDRWRQMAAKSASENIRERDCRKIVFFMAPVCCIRHLRFSFLMRFISLKPRNMFSDVGSTKSLSKWAGRYPLILGLANSIAFFRIGLVVLWYIPFQKDKPSHIGSEKLGYQTGSMPCHTLLQGMGPSTIQRFCTKRL